MGRGWTVGPEVGRALLVAGGVGAAPLFPLALGLLAEGAQVHVVMGALDCGLLALRKDFEALLGKERLHICTDDGSAGHHGLATELASALIGEGHKKGSRFDYLATCGPHGMQRAVARIAAEEGIPCEVSLEERMACGIGACLS